MISSTKWKSSANEWLKRLNNCTHTRDKLGEIVTQEILKGKIKRALRLGWELIEEKTIREKVR